MGEKLFLFIFRLRLEGGLVDMIISQNLSISNHLKSPLSASDFGVLCTCPIGYQSVKSL
mgnify:CR=1